MPPTHRPLKTYAFDPSRGRTLGNFMTIRVPYEPLKRGPVGEQIAVVDYDASQKCYYDSIDLDSPDLLIQEGLDPSESDPRFHQQMVYAIVRETMSVFEFALGRPVKWAFGRYGKGGNRERNDSRLLRVYPHAMEEANAYYSREQQALLFGYFTASQTDAGRSLPGQTVFTCLSHDIVVHETAHALVDGLKDFFMEPTGPDTLAFHEAFADIVALFQHFSYKEVLADTIQRSGGYLHQQVLVSSVLPQGGIARFQFEDGEANPLVELARQFGEARGKRAALRSAIGSKPNPEILQSVSEPHDRGAILVAAVFDAYFASYLRRARDWFVIAVDGGKDLRPGHLHPVLVDNLARIASSTAKHFATMCIRALDYCPPVDISFGDFLRALITVDSDLVPDDRHQYRDSLIQAFRLRGIHPRDARSLSEDSLRWTPPTEALREKSCSELQFASAPAGSFVKAQKGRIAKMINKFAKTNAEALRLDPDLKVAVHRFHPVYRVGPDGRLLREVVSEIVQARQVPFDPGSSEKNGFVFRGGVTLVFNQDGSLRYSIHKDVNSEERLERERAFRCTLVDSHAAFHYAEPDDAGAMRINFAALHGGY